MYQSLKDELQQKEQTLKDQEPIHSEVEVVKQQLEENKVQCKRIYIHNIMCVHIHQVLVNYIYIPYHVGIQLFVFIVSRNIIKV